MLRVLFVCFALAVVATPAAALGPEEIMEDPALDARARAIYEQLRCVVCSNQSIADSDARMAADMRGLVRDQLLSGDSDREIFDFLIGAYGDYILMRPRFTWSTAIVWIAPVAALGVGLFWAWRRMRPSAATAAAAPTVVSEPSQPGLSDDERRRLDQIMRQD